MEKMSLCRSILVFICCWSSCAVLAAEPLFRSGIYDDDELIVALDSTTREISGYYKSYTGAGQFSCIFYFQGKLEGSHATIMSYFPEDANNKIEGTLTVTGPKELKIVLRKEHGGCWNVRHFADAQDPAIFTLSQAHDDWQTIKVVKATRAHFYQSPEETARRKSYIVKNDGVGVKRSNGAWLEVDFSNANGIMSGWIHAADFF
jgi:hypothetical protein